MYHFINLELELHFMLAHSTPPRRLLFEVKHVSERPSVGLSVYRLSKMVCPFKADRLYIIQVLFFCEA